MIMLGLRTSHKEKLGCNSSHALYGHALQLPLVLLETDTADSVLDMSSYTDNLRAAMQKLQPPCTRAPRKGSGYIDKQLLVCPYGSYAMMRAEGCNQITIDLTKSSTAAKKHSSYSWTKKSIPLALID